MSEEILTALVLGATNLGESDRLMHLLTRERGRIAARARGARKSRKRYGGRLERYALIRARVRVRRGRSALGDVDLVRPFLGARDDLLRTAMADHLLELVRTVTRDDEPVPELFGLLLQVLAALDTGADPGEAWVRAASMRVLQLAGVGLSLDGCCACGRPPDRYPAGFAASTGGLLCADHAPGEAGAVPLSRHDHATLLRLASADLADPAGIAVQAEAVRRVRGHLARFAEYHLERRLRTAGFLDELLDAEPG